MDLTLFQQDTIKEITITDYHVNCNIGNMKIKVNNYAYLIRTN